MPTDHDDDVEISAMLNQAEPPRSPQHLDDAILKYAREKAAESTPGQGSVSWLSLSWLQQNWMPAAATLSVAAIAVSVSLQIFTEPDLQSVSKAGLAEIPLSDSVSTRQSAPASAAVEAELEVRPSSALQDGVARSIASSDVAAEPVLERRQSAVAGLSQTATPQIADATATAAQAQPSAARANLSAVQAVEELIEADPNQTAIALSAGIANDRAEEDLAGNTTARSGVRRTTASTQELAPGFSESLAEDAELQETVVVVLRRSLGADAQTAVAVQPDFSLQVDPLIEAYRQLSNPAELLSAQTRYAEARSERLDSELPDSLAELVALLEALED